MSVKVTASFDKGLAMARMRAGETRGVRAAGYALLAEAVKQVPLASSALQTSGDVDYDETTATVSFDTPYAVRWHEESANFQHGRKNKYLEDPLNDAATQDAMLKAIQGAIKEEL